MVYDNDPDWVFEKGGIRAARRSAEGGQGPLHRLHRAQGSQHPSEDAQQTLQAWATAQMPINVCDYFFRSFLHEVVPQCLQQGTGVIGMKTLGGGCRHPAQ